MWTSVLFVKMPWRSETSSFVASNRNSSVCTPSRQRSTLGNWDRARLEQVVTNLLSNAVKVAQGIGWGCRSADRTGRRGSLCAIMASVFAPKTARASSIGSSERLPVRTAVSGSACGSCARSSAFDGVVAASDAPGGGAVLTIDLPVERGDRLDRARDLRCTAIRAMETFDLWRGKVLPRRGAGSMPLFLGTRWMMFGRESTTGSQRTLPASDLSSLQWMSVVENDPQPTSPSVSVGGLGE